MDWTEFAVGAAAGAGSRGVREMGLLAALLQTCLAIALVPYWPTVLFFAHVQ